MQNFNALPLIGFIRIKQVLAVFPVSRSTWYEGIKSGKYPAPVKLSERTAAWRTSDIHALLAFYADTTSNGIPIKNKDSLS